MKIKFFKGNFNNYKNLEEEVNSWIDYDLDGHASFIGVNTSDNQVLVSVTYNQNYSNEESEKRIIEQRQWQEKKDRELEGQYPDLLEKWEEEHGGKENDD